MPSAHAGQQGDLSHAGPGCPSSPYTSRMATTCARNTYTPSHLNNTQIITSSNHKQHPNCQIINNTQIIALQAALQVPGDAHTHAITASPAALLLQGRGRNKGPMTAPVLAAACVAPAQCPVRAMTGTARLHTERAGRGRGGVEAANQLQSRRHQVVTTRLTVLVQLCVRWGL